MNKKLEKIIYIVSFIIVLLFIYYLPELSSLSRDRLSKVKVEEEKTPIIYKCERNDKSELHNYTLKQYAIYNLEKTNVKKADIEREYKFQTKEAYNKYITTEIKDTKHDYETVNYEYDDVNFVVKEKLIVNDVNAKNKSEPQFPRLYVNLLQYTKGQVCEEVYE
jgi:hypothetical protein